MRVYEEDQEMIAVPTVRWIIVLATVKITYIVQ